jgi:hypothetical protein
MYVLFSSMVLIKSADSHCFSETFTDQEHALNDKGNLHR